MKLYCFIPHSIGLTYAYVMADSLDEAKAAVKQQAPEFHEDRYAEDPDMTLIDTDQYHVIVLEPGVVAFNANC